MSAHMNRIVLTLVVGCCLVAVQGCSSNAPSGDKSSQTCVREKELGSHITTTKCYSQAQYKELKRRADEMINSPGGAPGKETGDEMH